MTEPARRGPRHDLLVVGAGLSGSLLTVRLVESLLVDPASEALQIVLLDRDGIFGGGVPYGDRHTLPHLLLLEPAVTSTPPEFQQWLLGRRDQVLAELGASPEAVL